MNFWSKKKALLIFAIFLFSGLKIVLGTAIVENIEVCDFYQSEEFPLTITIEGLKSAEGKIYLGLYGEGNKFLDDKDKLDEYEFTPKMGKVTVQIKDIKYGVYAFALYHDVNDDGKMNNNFLGIPKEPYAFSDNYRPRFRAPRFDECKINYNQHSHKFTVRLID